MAASAKKSMRKPAPRKTAKRGPARRKSAAGKAADKNMPRGYAPIAFTGAAGEYFAIWVVTLLLTILTLGLYWPWAKVRRRRYFASHTELDGYGMAYHATGGRLFIGFVLAVIVVSIVGVISSVSTVGAVLLGSVALFFFLPWAINRALSFHARYTSWRNIHLRWTRKYWWMLLITNIFPIVNLASLGLLMPITTRVAYHHFVRKHAFGKRRFNAKMPLGKAYGALFFAILGVIIIMTVPVFFVLAGTAIFLPGAGEVGFALVPYLLILSAYIFTGIFRTLCRNHLIKSMRLGNVVRFTSVMHPARYIWIELSNTFAIIASLGLLIPWAAIRKYRYLCICTGYKVSGDVNKFVEGALQKQGAFGEEFAAAEGAGFDLGL